MSTQDSSPLGKLNVGCGRAPLQGWINLDAIQLPGVDIVADLEQCATKPLPISTDSIDQVLMSHVLEHIRQPLPLMQELWRVCVANATIVIRVPYGSSDDAYDDPTHVRQLFRASFDYFSQPTYWRADYGYRGDWQPEHIRLLVPKEDNIGLAPQQVLQKVVTSRNVVKEMVAELRCVKPARQPRREFQVAPVTHIQLI